MNSSSCIRLERTHSATCTNSIRAVHFQKSFFNGKKQKNGIYSNILLMERHPANVSVCWWKFNNSNLKVYINWFQDLSLVKLCNWHAIFKGEFRDDKKSHYKINGTLISYILGVNVKVYSCTFEACCRVRHPANWTRLKISWNQKTPDWQK